MYNIYKQVGFTGKIKENEMSKIEVLRLLWWCGILNTIIYGRTEQQNIKHYIVSGKTIEIMGALLLYRTAHAHTCI